MQQYLLLFIGKQPPEDDSPETKAYLGEWGTWMASLTMRGLLDSGLPVDWNGKVVNKDEIKDFEPETIDVGGYMVINAENIDHAAQIAQEAPSVVLGGEVIVRPAVEMG